MYVPHVQVLQFDLKKSTKVWCPEWKLVSKYIGKYILFTLDNPIRYY